MGPYSDYVTYKKKKVGEDEIERKTSQATELINKYDLKLLFGTDMMVTYPEGEIGVLQKGSFADILIVRGNPVEDLDLLYDVDHLLLIMKDGKVYKNTLSSFTADR